MNEWSNVDEYINEMLVPNDAVLADVLRANAEGGLPPHDVSPSQGKFLMLLAQCCGASTILEIGTLGGYSTIWLARGLHPKGRITTLEIDPARAQLARRNFERAGVADRIDVMVGPAADSLATLRPAFDLIFVDADKVNNRVYLTHALRLSRVGTLVVADNVVRGGAILDAASTDENVRGIREIYEFFRDEPRFDATALQLVGSKGWDGLALARVRS